VLQAYSFVCLRLKHYRHGSVRTARQRCHCAHMLLQRMACHAAAQSFACSCSSHSHPGCITSALRWSAWLFTQEHCSLSCTAMESTERRQSSGSMRITAAVMLAAAKNHVLADCRMAIIAAQLPHP
jgi:hypothetical protein